MKREIIFRSCAEKDISVAVRWYEAKVSGLGKRFLLSLDATIQSISRNPEAFPKVYKEFRRSLLRKFQYSIFYIIAGSKIMVFAVFHEKRNPKNWKKRTK